MRGLRLRRRDILRSVTAIMVPPIQAQKQAKDRALAEAGDRFRIGAVSYRLDSLLAPSADAFIPAIVEASQAARLVLQRVLDTPGVSYVLSGETTRWGEQIITLTDENGTLVPMLTLIEAGAVRVFPQGTEPDIAKDFFAAEDKARLAGTGLWQSSFFRRRQANRLEDCRDTPGAHHIFSGTVMAVGQSRSRTFLNFGADYREDVTGVVERRDMRRWSEEAIKIDGLEGALVEFRGFVEWINGPSISLRYPAQLRRLTPGKKGGAGEKTGDNVDDNKAEEREQKPAAKPPAQ